ncbi:hypothetical protein DMENIID0001_155170 [Sergentomyia squamirostris]
MRLILVTLFVVFAVSSGGFPGIGDILPPIGPNLYTEINEIYDNLLNTVEPELETLSECVGADVIHEFQEELQNQISSIQTAVYSISDITGNVLNINETVLVARPIEEIGILVPKIIGYANSQPPMGHIDLYTCCSDRVAPAPRDVSTRMNTLMLELKRPSRETDVESLVLHKRGKDTIVRYLLSADTSQARDAWIDKLNKALSLTRSWPRPTAD